MPHIFSRTRSKIKPSFILALQTPTVNQSVPTSPQRSQKKKDTLMMGDPRRLTLPLQRTKKLGVKHDKGRDSVVHGKPNEDQKSTNEEVDEERVSASSGAGINDEESNGFGEADEEGKENSPFDQQANGDNLNSRNSNENLKVYMVSWLHSACQVCTVILDKI